MYGEMEKNGHRDYSIVSTSQCRHLLLQDADDLPFRKGEILYVVNKDEDQWWTARNSQGHIGQIPVPYVQRVSIICISLIAYNHLTNFKWIFYNFPPNHFISV